jgi:hypothetical protein
MLSDAAPIDAALTDAALTDAALKDAALKDAERDAQHDARSTLISGSISAAQQQRPASTRATQPDPAVAADCSRNTNASTNAVKRRPAEWTVVRCVDRRVVTRTA